MKKILLTTVFMSAFTGHAALAQNNSDENANEASSQQGQDFATGDIIVTAQKQAQSLQLVPIAVTAVSGDTLVSAGITNIMDAQRLMPSVRFQSQGASSEIYIRGIGQTNDFANTEAPTAMNINGVYTPRDATVTPFYDVERMELVPGPQGTLYGRSVLGGAVNVIWQRPVFSDEVKGVAEAGNYDFYHVTGIGNAALSDSTAIRFAVDYTNRDGYMTSGAGKRDAVGGRLSFLAEPTDDLTVYLWGYLTRSRGSAQGNVNRGFNPATGVIDGTSFLNDRPWDDTYTGNLEPFAIFGPIHPFPEHYNDNAIGAQIDWKIGDVTITAIPSYLKLKSRKSYFLSSLLGIYNVDIEQSSGELRASGDTGRLNWLIGLNGYHTVTSDLAQIPGIFANTVDRNLASGVGIFGQATYSFTDEFRFTVGGRYSSDLRAGRGRASDATGNPTIPFTAHNRSKHTDWKVGMEYDVALQSMLYANAQSGYQPGIYNAFPSSATFDNSLDAPTITAYTAGIKNRFFDNILQANFEGFYYIYKGLPLQAFNVNLAFNQIVNSQRVEIYGLQSDFLLRPSTDDQFNLSIGYLHGRQTNVVLPTGEDFSGLQLQFAPDWTISAGYYHDFHLSKGYVRANVDTRYESSFWGDFRHSIGTRQKAYIMSNASLTYYADDDRWSIGAWIKNIENEPVQGAVGAGGVPGPAIVYLMPPRTYGLRATFSY